MGTKTFALGEQGRTILKLDRGHQELLFEARADTFQPFRFGPNVWAYVELDHLDEAELAALLLEAWAQIVPKRVSRPLLQPAVVERPPSEP